MVLYYLKFLQVRKRTNFQLFLSRFNFCHKIFIQRFFLGFQRVSDCKKYYEDRGGLESLQHGLDSGHLSFQQQTLMKKNSTAVNTLFKNEVPENYSQTTCKIRKLEGKKIIFHILNVSE